MWRVTKHPDRRVVVQIVNGAIKHNKSVSLAAYYTLEDKERHIFIHDDNDVNQAYKWDGFDSAVEHCAQLIERDYPDEVKYV